MTHQPIAKRLGQEEFLAQPLHRDHRYVPGTVADPDALVSVSCDTLNDLITTHRSEMPRLRLSAGGEIPAQRRHALPRRPPPAHRLAAHTHPAAMHQRLPPPQGSIPTTMP
ncbi:hypothetical protein [Streptomyces sp. NPDC048612]|uniref:hypothetical protein n=1 Tax=Streptomyces sp. NPDC048612 TaxID=3365579 RepID=UPI003717CD54